MHVRSVEAAERLEFVFMSCRCKVYFATSVALCAAQTSLLASAVFFFFDFAACILFKFAANALKHV